MLAWSIYSAVTERKMHITISDIDDYFEIADSDRSYEEKLDGYEALADAHFDREPFEVFCQEHLADLDEAILELIESPAFDSLLVESVRAMFPEAEHDHFIAHYRGLLTHWVQSERQ